jgi:heterodisulfide reductase subunit A-like polyferredoxin
VTPSHQRATPRLTSTTGTRTSALSPEARTASIEQMQEQELDVLVVGGGVVGTGCALDAVTRGLRVGMVEARDWASGPPAGPASCCTAACATWRCSTSRW